MNKYSIIFAAVVSAVIAGVVYAKSISDDICFDLSQTNVAEVCYSTGRFFNKNGVIQDQYYRLVDAMNTLDDGDAALKNLLQIEPSFEEGIGKDRAYKGMRRYWSWIQKSSLKHIIRGEKVSAVLLTRTDTDDYALYFDNATGLFILSYDIPEQYLPIAQAWVNREYATRRIAVSTIFSQQRDSTCLFKKESVVLYTEDVRSIEDGGWSCHFGKYEYSVRENVGENRIRSTDALDGEVDAWMQFIRWAGQ